MRDVNGKCLIGIDRNWMGLDQFDLRIIWRQETTQILRQAQPIKFEAVEEGRCIDPVLSLKKEELQLLMDELWQIGIRPSNGECSVGEIGAIRDHLADMKQIAFHKLGIEVKK